jgi:chromate transporter
MSADTSGNKPGSSARDGVAISPLPATPWRLFWVFVWINTVTLGGGYAIVPVIGTSLQKRGWVTEDDFWDIFARAQAYPGPSALSTAMLSSIKLCGFWGAVAAFFVVVVPPFLAIILVSSLLTKYGSLPAVKRFLAGAGAVVPGLVAAMVWRTAKRRSWTAPRVVEVVALTMLLILFPSMSLPILLGGIAALYVVEGLWKR